MRSKFALVRDSVEQKRIRVCRRRRDFVRACPAKLYIELIPAHRESARVGRVLPRGCVEIELTRRRFAAARRKIVTAINVSIGGKQIEVQRGFGTEIACSER